MGMAYGSVNKAVDEVVSMAMEVKEEEEEEEEEWEYQDETQVYLRSKFYESWMWMEVNLPSEAGRDG